MYTFRDLGYRVQGVEDLGFRVQGLGKFIVDHAGDVLEMVLMVSWFASGGVNRKKKEAPTSYLEQPRHLKGKDTK